MHISNIGLQELPCGLDEVSADVFLRNPRPHTFRIWFRGPRGCFGGAPLGDIFFASYWIPAMFLQEEFEIEGEVSRELLNGAYEKLEPVMLRWFRDDLRPARVAQATLVDRPTPPAPGTGVIFSGGLDSSYVLLKHLDAVTHLVFIHGWEIPWNRDDLADHALKSVREVADSLGKELVVLKSNMTEPFQHIIMVSGEQGRSRPVFVVDMCFGSMLVAFGMCVRGLLGRSMIAASWSYEYTQPRGSHPMVEPSWSTSTLGVSLEGCEADRMQKVEYVLRHRPELFRTLRVCMDPRDRGAVNCGRCAKCLRTMMEMRVAGASEGHFPSFERPLDLELASCAFYDAENRLIPDLLQKAEAVGDHEIARVARIILGERIYLPRIRERLRQRYRSWTRRRKLRKRGQWTPREIREGGAPT